jgi:SulP family sulfate permease
MDDGSSFFRPKLLDCLRDYSRRKFHADLIAGLTVGIVALPLAMAFAIASGVKPEAGLFTAIVAGFLISALGGSKVQIGGPTGAFIVIVYGIVMKHGLDGLAVCTMMAGVILFILGATRLGRIVQFIPYPVTSGFTAGIAVLIFSTQLKDFLGLRMDQPPAEFFARMRAYLERLDTFDPVTVLLAAASVAVIFAWPKRWARRFPGSIVAMILATAAVWLFNLPVETIGTKFGDVPHTLPAFHAPELSWGRMRELFQPATTIAILAAIESLLSAVVADGMIDDRHDSNQELMAQGVANFLVPLVGGIPATGAIARTATNIKNGAATPISGIVHALVLLLIMAIAAPLAKHIPLAALSAVLIAVSVNMAEWHEFRRLLKLPRSDAAVLVTAFMLTVIIDLTIAVEVGMVMAVLLFIKRISETTQVTPVDETSETEGSHHSVVGKNIPRGVLVYRIFGAFLFGAAEKLETALIRAHQEPEVLILRVRKVIAMDATGLNALESLHEKLRARGKHLILCGPHTQPYAMMERAGFLDQVGRENVTGNLDEALERARQILAEKN